VLNLNVHCHVPVPDGAWFPEPGPATPTFCSVQSPFTGDVEALVVRIADACERFLARERLGKGELADDEPTPTPPRWPAPDLQTVPGRRSSGSGSDSPPTPLASCALHRRYRRVLPLPPGA